MTFRARLVVVVGAAVTALAGGGGALACTNVHLGTSTPVVAPGGTIRFTITNLVAGAAWSVSLDGGPTRSGVASGDGAVTGELTMPDLGSATRTLGLSGVVIHEDIDGSPWPVSAPGGVAYEAPAVAAPAQAVPQPATPPPAATPQPPPAEATPAPPGQTAPVAASVTAPVST